MASEPNTLDRDNADAAGVDRFDLSLFQLEAQGACAPSSNTHRVIEVVDLHAIDARAGEGRVGEGLTADQGPAKTFSAAPAKMTDDDQEPRMRSAGPGWGAMAVALGWVGAAVAAPIASIGLDRLLSQSPLTLAALAALVVLPPMVIVSCSTAVREAQRARFEQQRLTRFARRVMLGPDEMEGRASEMGRSIRAEIEDINRSMIGALDRMAQLEAAAIRNAHAFEDAVNGARTGASALSEALNGERAAFAELNRDLQAQTEGLGAVVGRQIRMMREASHLVRQETTRADQSLTAHIAALATSTAALGEKTETLGHVVNAASHGAGHLDQTLAGALHTLGEATKLNDSARQSAETSAIAAQQAAQAVRDASVRAAADARRVTEIIRAETKAMHDQAQATLETLRLAADEARRAAEHSEATAAYFSGGRARQHPEAAPVFAPAAAAPTVARSASRRGAHALAMAAPANDMDPGVDLRARMLRLVEDAGVDLDRTFTTADLDYIAGRSKDGPAARRRAVTLAAMEAVERLSQRLSLDAYAQDIAAAFRAKPDLAGHGAGRQALKAYLLVDAALG